MNSNSVDWTSCDCDTSPFDLNYYNQQISGVLYPDSSWFGNNLWVSYHNPKSYSFPPIVLHCSASSKLFLSTSNSFHLSNYSPVFNTQIPVGFAVFFLFPTTIPSPTLFLTFFSIVLHQNYSVDLHLSNYSLIVHKNLTITGTTTTNFKL